MKKLMLYGVIPFDPKKHWIVEEDLTDIRKVTITCSCGKRWRLPIHLAALERFKADSQIMELRRMPR